MQFQLLGADAIRAVSQRWLIKYWNHLRQEKPLPLWERIDIHELKPVIDSVNVYDVMRNGEAPRFMVRYQGEKITQAYGGDCSGKFFDEVLPPIVRDATLAVYWHAVECRQPVYTISEARDRDGMPVHHERLLLPFSVAGDRVDRIFAALELISMERKFDQRNLMRAQAAAPVYSLNAVIRPDHF